jgi:hypothetical protein
MRYLHRSADEICRYVRSGSLAVTKCDYAASSPPIAVNASAIEEMLKRSETLWGLALPYYLCVSEAVETEGIPLKEAVSKIEASSAKDRFLIVAYQDGGIISVSGIMLPFQEEARIADWWAPYTSASHSLG